MSAMHDLIN